MSICHRCGMRAGSSDECAECTTFYREVLAQCRRDERERDAAKEMLKALKVWARLMGALGGTSLEGHRKDCACPNCVTLAIIAKIEEV